MKVFSASTTIHASPERLWSILTDAAGYAEWDPYAIRIEGTIADGETITAYTKLSPKRAFPVKVGDFQPNRCMTWTGGLPLGLFKGVRSFNLTPVPAGVDFSVREEFSGPLLPLFAGSLPDMTESFQAFVAGLKARAEHVDG